MIDSLLKYLETGLAAVVAVSCLMLAVCTTSAIRVQAQDTATDRFAILIGGLGGSPEHSEKFEQYLFDARKALVDDIGFSSDHVVVLAEAAIKDREFVDDVSTAENIRLQFESLASRVGVGDHVYVMLFGHGSFDGDHAQLNIPRRDLTESDYSKLVDALGAGRVVFINTASASAPFVGAISAPGRIVATATKTGTERNETVFPGFLVEGLSGLTADLDRNGDVSVGELFRYAAENTTRHFEETSHLATEHAILEDTGDGVGYRVEELDNNGEGNLASVTYLRSRESALASVSPADRDEVSRLVVEKEKIEGEIAGLKSKKANLEEDEYYESLEALLVELSRLDGAIEALSSD